VKRGILFIGILILVAACESPLASLTATPANEDAAEKIVREYSGWTKMFDEARAIAMGLMVMCRMMTDEEQAFVNSEHGQAYVQVYANPTGAATMQQQGARVFPEGSVIVKEKWGIEAGNPNDDSSAKRTGLGIMVKREKDFNAQVGDWEYLYMDEAGTIHRDQKKLQHCIACHSGIQERDSIFYPEAPGQF
jgi:hypothetical protein